ncbi:Membrane-bound lytic murein transglycosylase A precursor [Planctomycetes bacterium Poly30]|uniref:peptidoglycan lytic exotransglycosylase n=1 Tax=Saltatorellus ferox TaxID=2528018 RepID=A0A518F0F0_9BACT|nr:Membrane-bound lytic murein transglycosylase A precursor [Planctomycetes bacterium Poly30]
MNRLFDRLLTLTASCVVCLSACQTYRPVRTTVEVDYGRALPVGADALIRLGPGDPVPDLTGCWVRREEILPVLDLSLAFTRSKHAAQFFPIEGISQERAILSLERMADLLETTASAADFQRAFEEEFDVYMSAGWDGRGGGVLFTGYCTPLLPGSLQRTARFQYPLHALPPDLIKAKDGTTLGQETRAGLRPYPKRREILSDPAYRNLEIVWLEDPVDAYIAHVNGSAFVELENGDIARFGYAGKNGQPYTSLGKALIEAGEVPADEMSLAAIRRWADRTDPARIQGFLDRNESYVFFTPIKGNPHGSLNLPVTAERSLATDKTLFPRGAIVFVDTELPTPQGGLVPFQQMMFDQDTGGAIRTAGRADIYMGVGHRAEQLSGAIQSPGQMYYLFLK